MPVTGHIEGGGSFTLSDQQVMSLRAALSAESDTIFGKLRAALPPEPYVPQVGERVDYQRDHMDSWFSAEYRGEVDGLPILKPSGTPFPFILAQGKIRKAED